MASSSHVLVGAPVHPAFMDAIDFNDLETSKLIAQLTLEDISRVGGGRKGKGRYDALPSDEEVAFMIQCDYWNGIIQIIDDHLLAQSISTAVEVDQTHINVLSTVEQAAADDRAAAEALSRGQSLPVQTQAQRLVERKEFFDQLDEAEPSPPIVEHEATVEVPTPSVKAGTSSQETTLVHESDQDKTLHDIVDSVRNLTVDSAAKGKEKSTSAMARTRVTCVICGDLIRGVRLHNDCDHDYCADCVISLVDACTRDETLYPPRCCHQPLKYEDIVPLLNVELREAFDAKRRELDVSPENRIYCPMPTCSAFLGSNAEADSDFTCPNCQIPICPQCSQVAHPGESCSENVAVQALKDLAQREGWQTCPQCKAIIELNQGCHHITCRCHAQFCYVCAERWKNCSCPQWDENRIIYTAEQRVRNELGAGVHVEQPVFRERVAAMVETIRNNHDCYLHRWKSRGPGTCEECSDYMPVFTLVCQNCRLRACRRCARNRL